MGSGVDFHSMLGFSGLNLVFVEVWPNRCLMAVKIHIILGFQLGLVAEI